MVNKWTSPPAPSSPPLHPSPSAHPPPLPHPLLPAVRLLWTTTTARQLLNELDSLRHLSVTRLFLRIEVDGMDDDVPDNTILSPNIREYTLIEGVLAGQQVVKATAFINPETRVSLEPVGTGFEWCMKGSVSGVGASTRLAKLSTRLCT